MEFYENVNLLKRVFSCSVVISCHFILVSSNHTEITFAGKYLPPFHEIFVQKSPIEKYFWLDLCYLSTRFSKLLFHILRQVKSLGN